MKAPIFLLVLVLLMDMWGLTATRGRWGRRRVIRLGLTAKYKASVAWMRVMDCLPPVGRTIVEG